MASGCVDEPTWDGYRAAIFISGWRLFVLVLTRAILRGFGGRCLVRAGFFGETVRASRKVTWPCRGTCAVWQRDGLMFPSLADRMVIQLRALHSNLGDSNEAPGAVPLKLS